MKQCCFVKFTWYEDVLFTELCLRMCVYKMFYKYKVEIAAVLLSDSMVNNIFCPLNEASFVQFLTENNRVVFESGGERGSVVY